MADSCEEQEVLVSGADKQQNEKAIDFVLDLAWMKHACGSEVTGDGAWTAARSFEDFHSLGVVQILREAIVILRIDASFFGWILSGLLVPLSVVILCQVLVTGPVIKNLAANMEAAAEVRSLPVNPLYKIFFLKISENVVANVICSPFIITLALLSKVSISYKVACIYAGYQLPFWSFAAAVSKLYKRVTCTYMWIILCTLGSVTSFVLLLVVVTFLLNFLRFSADIVFLGSAAVAVMFCVFFAHLLAICNLANVVSILEDTYGGSALTRAMSLIKGRSQVALLLLLFNTTLAALVDGLFQYRVVGKPTYHYAKDVSRIWESPLLVLMYSCLLLCDSIMNTIFYFTCKSFIAENALKNSSSNAIQMTGF